MTERLLADAWVRTSIALGAVLLAISAIIGLPWPLWLGWAYLALISVADVRRRPDRPVNGP